MRNFLGYILIALMSTAFVFALGFDSESYDAPVFAYMSQSWSRFLIMAVFYGVLVGLSFFLADFFTKIKIRKRA